MGHDPTMILGIWVKWKAKLSPTHFSLCRCVDLDPGQIDTLALTWLIRHSSRPVKGLVA